MSETARLQCIHPDCAATIALDDTRFACHRCGGLLDVAYDFSKLNVAGLIDRFDARWHRSRPGDLDFSGVWRFRELLPFAPESAMQTIGEGRTLLQAADRLAARLGMQPGKLFLQYEGFNPSGSFKDNGMAGAFTMAKLLGRKRVACASTGNTSASMALFAATCGTVGDAPLQAVVFVGSGKIAMGKLAQALDYGALTLQIDGDFDACMARVGEMAADLDMYVCNSINPFRLEGQKTIIYRILEGLNWKPPDWIVVPGGNLGNTSAFGKALGELQQIGLIDRIPRLAVINAAGADTLFELVNKRSVQWNDGRLDFASINGLYDEHTRTGWKAKTVASAIEIGRPVNLPKALRSLVITDGLVRRVDDESILDHKALVGACGYGCEPASAASVAGLHALLDEQIIGRDETVVCVLTGHGLKDPDATVRYHNAPPDDGGRIDRRAHANRPIAVADNADEIARVIREHSPREST